MTFDRPVPAAAWSLLFLCLGLAGCAASAPALPIASPSVQMGARFDPAIVAAIRQVDLATDTGSRPGVQYVLNALQQNAPAGPVAADEIVLVKADGTAASMVERPPGTPPGLADGDRVAILEGSPTTLIHRN